MIVINLSHDNYPVLLKNLARQLKVSPNENCISLPRDVGEGIIKVILLPNGLQILMVKIFTNKDVVIKSGNSNDGDYVLNFDEAEFSDEKNKTINSFVRLTGASFKHWGVVKKKSLIQYLKILFSKQWLANYIGLSEKISQFEKYIPVKTDAAQKEKLNEEYKRIINEMWLINDDDPLQNICYNNRVMLLIEQFFTKMHAEMLSPKGKYKLTADDIIKLKKVESGLNNFSKSPPNIPKLAKKINMPQVKLAQSFKQVYGYNIYNYYQAQRMQKAHELLSTKNYSVKDVSEKLGYINISNFILSFSKQFGISPKSLLE